jgi:hypothetical protein
MVDKIYELFLFQVRYSFKNHGKHVYGYTGPSHYKSNVKDFEPELNILTIGICNLQNPCKESSDHKKKAHLKGGPGILKSHAIQ